MNRMTKWMPRLIGLVALAVFACVAGAAPAKQQPTLPPPEDETLAERFSELGRRMLQSRNLTEPMWRQAAALMEAANTLNPYEERFVRMMAEYDVLGKDVDGAIAAYKKLL